MASGIDRPIFAAVLSILLTIAGAIVGFEGMVSESGIQDENGLGRGSRSSAIGKDASLASSTRTAKMEIRPVLPSFLLTRGWAMVFDNPGSGSVSLGPRDTREIRPRLVGGQSFTAAGIVAAGTVTMCWRTGWWWAG